MLTTESGIAVTQAVLAEMSGGIPDFTTLDVHGMLIVGELLERAVSVDLTSDPVEVWKLVKEKLPIPVPMAPVGQLFQRDVPSFGYPDGVDLLQILWCGADHYHSSPDGCEYVGPWVELRWRASADLESGAVDVSGAKSSQSEDRLSPCLLSPEEVWEYPAIDELPPDLSGALRRLDDAMELDYQYGLSVARGWKLGGWPAWHATDRQKLECPDCGGAVTLLIKMDDSEWDGGSDRWQPVEDRGLSQSDEDDAWEPTGVEFGRGSELRVFVCKDDPWHRPLLNTQ